MKRGWFVLVFVVLAGLMFYSTPLKAQTQEFVFDEKIVTGVECSATVGFEEVGSFVDGNDLEYKHCVKRSGSSFVIDSYFYKVGDVPECPTGENKGFFSDVDSSIVILCVEVGEGAAVEDVFIGGECGSGFEGGESIEVQSGEIVHCRKGGVEKKDVGRRARAVSGEFEVKDCSGLSESECEDNGCTSVYAGSVSENPSVIGCTNLRKSPEVFSGCEGEYEVEVECGADCGLIDGKTECNSAGYCKFSGGSCEPSTCESYDSSGSINIPTCERTLSEDDDVLREIEIVDGIPQGVRLVGEPESTVLCTTYNFEVQNNCGAEEVVRPEEEIPDVNGPSLAPPPFVEYSVSVRCGVGYITSEGEADVEGCEGSADLMGDLENIPGVCSYGGGEGSGGECGDGIVDGGEECDEGNKNGANWWCNSGCKARLPSYCKNEKNNPKGIIFYPECLAFKNLFDTDEGKNKNGKGCSYVEGGQLKQKSDGIDCQNWLSGGTDPKDWDDINNNAWGICNDGVCSHDEGVLESIGKSCSCTCGDGKRIGWNEYCEADEELCAKKQGKINSLRGNICKLTESLVCKNSEEVGTKDPIKARQDCEARGKHFYSTFSIWWGGSTTCYCIDK